MVEANCDRRSPIVYVFVRNPISHYSRILRQARTLVSEGYDVRVVAVEGEGLPELEDRDGFQIIRVPISPLHYRALWAYRVLRRLLLRTPLLPVRAVRFAYRRLRRGAASGTSSASPAPAVAIESQRHAGDATDAATEEAGPKVSARGRSSRRSSSPLSRTLFRGWTVVLVALTILVASLGGLLLLLFAPFGLLLAYIDRSLYNLLRRIMLSWIVHRPLVLLDYVFRSYRIVRSHPGDIYHANELSALPAAYVMSRLFGGALVYDARELSIEAGDSARLDPLRKAILRKYEGFMARRADAVMTVNEAIAGVLASRYHLSPPTVVMNCPEPVAVMADDDPLRKRLNLSEERKIVLYHGNLTANRGHDKLIEACQFFKDVTVLVFVGNGRLKRGLERQAEQSPVQERIKFLPAVPPDEVLRYVACANVGVIAFQPSEMNHTLATPNKLFDYLMVGVPQAVSDFPEMGRIVKENQVGAVFDPEEPQDIARAVNSILESPDYEAMGRRARAIAREKYCWPVQAEALKGIYRDITSRVVGS